MTSPQTPDIKAPNPSDLIPENRRRYLAGEAPPQGIKVYEGERGAAFVDTVEEHIHSQEDAKTDGGIFDKLRAHPNHGHDIVEWSDGTTGPRNEPPKDKEDKPLKATKIVERRQATTLRGDRIRPDATEVHVSDEPSAKIQAKYRLPNGKLEAIKTKEDVGETRFNHWEKLRQLERSMPKLQTKLEELRQDPDSMSDEDTIIHLAEKYFFRHGHRENMEARGASTLLVDDVTIDGDTVTFNFASKSNQVTEVSRTDPVTAQLLSKRMEGKEGHQRIFEGTAEKRTNGKLKELLEGNFSMKWLRTYGATQLGLKHLNAEIKSVLAKKTPLNTQKDLEAIQKRVSLEVGKELGHKKDGEYTGDTAFKSYISPVIWGSLENNLEKNQKKTDIQKAHTPDWHEKTPLEERDIDEYAEARKRKGENRQWGIREFGGQRKPLVKTWVQSLNEQGFIAPVIKQTNAGQMWFLNNGIDYVGTLGMNGEVFVEKATFKPTFNNPGISYNPAGRNKDVKTREPRKDVETLNFDETDDF